MTSTSSGPRDPLASLRIQRPDESAQRTGPRRGSVGRFVAALLGLVLVLAAVYAATRLGWISAPQSWQPLSEMLQTRVDVAIVVPTVETGRSAEALVVASGYLESRRQARIGARAPGRIEVVHVEEGSPVTKDQILAVLEHADLDASLSAAQSARDRALAQVAEQEIAVAQAKRDYDRAMQLRESKSLSESEFDKKQFDYEATAARLTSLKVDVALAEARMRESEQLRENMFVRAPFDGTVISKDAEVGESILPGGMGEASGRGSVVTIADLQHLEVDCDVKEDFIARVREGQTAEVAVDAVPDKRYQGRVRKIIPMGDRARATIKVKVEIIDADERLFPEMSGRVYFLPPEDGDSSIRPERRMFIPSAAVLERDGVTTVWVLDNTGRVHARTVSAGEPREGRREILDGLSETDRVVISPPELSENQLVNVRDE